MKHTKIAVSSVLALMGAMGSGGVAAQTVAVSAAISVPACTIATGAGASVSYTADASTISSATASSSRFTGSGSVGAAKTPVVELGQTNTTFSITCGIAQRVKLQLVDNTNDHTPGTFASAVLQSEAGTAGYLGTYQLIPGQPTVDGTARTLIARTWGPTGTWSAWSSGSPFLTSTAAATTGTEFAFADAAALTTPLTVSSVSIPVALNAFAFKPDVVAKARGGAIPTLNGSLTVSVQSF